MFLAPNYPHDLKNKDIVNQPHEHFISFKRAHSSPGQQASHAP